MINSKTSIKKCSGCAKEFTFKESITPHRKYCSKRCYLDASKWGVKKEETLIEISKCSGCDKDLDSKKYTACNKIYCDMACYQEANRWDKKSVVEVKKKNLFERFIQFLQNLRGK